MSNSNLITKSISATQTARLIGASNSPKRILCFHGGGGVGGQPDMLDSFATVLSGSGKISTAAAQYCTLQTYPDATFDDMLDDADIALDWALNNVQKSGLWVLGASFGALLALHAVMKKPDAIAGLILLNPVTDLGPKGFSNRVVNSAQHAHLSPLQAFKNHPALRDLKCLIVHGADDPVVPAQASKDFADIWPSGQCDFVTLKGATHGFFNRSPRDQETAALIQAFTHRDDLPHRNGPDRRKDQPRLPDDVRLLCCIGAQKAGTSWLFDQLSNNPNVQTGGIKEWHYFNALQDGGASGILMDRFALLQHMATKLRPGFHEENEPHLRKIRLLSDMLYPTTSASGSHHAYIQTLLRNRGHAPVVCDFTPAYSGLSAHGLTEIAALGDVRFLYILRDPVARMWSQIRMLKSQEGLENLSHRCIAHAREMCNTGRMQSVFRADYARTVAALDESADAVEYIFYEDLFSQKTMDQITSFIDVDPTPIEPTKRVNEGLNVTLPADLALDMTVALAPQYEAMFARFGAAVPKAWRDRYKTLTARRDMAS